MNHSEEIPAKIHSDSKNYCYHKKIPNVICLKPLEPFELFIMEITEKEEEEDNRSHMLCCDFKKDVTIFLTQFKENGQDFNMNNMNNREILNSIKTKRAYPICKTNIQTKKKWHCRVYDWDALWLYLYRICDRNKDIFPYAGILLRNMQEYFVHQTKEKEPNNRISIFYYHHHSTTKILLMSGTKICIRHYKFDPGKKIYVSMQRSDSVNVISMISFYHDFSLKAFSVDVVLKRITANSILTKEDLEKLNLPRTILQEMIRKGLQLFRHLQ
ncbi:uncharacterized protein LOC116844332 [Odontomachus brunneus]|uniref:uncharacterized protein LOC116844332 n=1 Tax=Odontomachus brunneus TaxID=486640 RepID=UPI0013F20C0A|nr:uncharacterized protein LOC116844332 [Odontomachus brunneus]